MMYTFYPTFLFLLDTSRALGNIIPNLNLVPECLFFFLLMKCYIGFIGCSKLHRAIISYFLLYIGLFYFGRQDRTIKKRLLLTLIFVLSSICSNAKVMAGACINMEEEWRVSMAIKEKRR